jgi:hypothetical protein
MEDKDRNFMEYFDRSEKEKQKMRKWLHEFANEVHEGECRIDHNGNCQNHFISQPCLVAEVRAFLKE